jgi:4-hydroxy-L-threonine phosphate dehydrogenase PdxA
MIKVGITHGDMNGIGYEVILKTFAEPSLTELCTPVIYGSSRAMFYYRKMFGSGLNPHSIARAEDAAPNKVNMLDCFAEEVDVTLGVPTPQAGAAALQALEEAVRDLKAGHIDVLLTAPINKHSNYNAQSFRLLHQRGQRSIVITCNGNHNTISAERISEILHRDINTSPVLLAHNSPWNIRQRNVILKWFSNGN